MLDLKPGASRTRQHGSRPLELIGVLWNSSDSDGGERNSDKLIPVHGASVQTTATSRTGHRRIVGGARMTKDISTLRWGSWLGPDGEKARPCMFLNRTAAHGLRRRRTTVASAHIYWSQRTQPRTGLALDSPVHVQDTCIAHRTRAARRRLLRRRSEGRAWRWDPTR